MNKSFMIFNDDDTEFRMLKEDTEDLTYLAPIIGDGRIPLDENPIEYVLPDMLDDIILSDCKLLSDDNVDGFLSSSSNSFFSYRDDTDSPSRPLSPMLSQNEDCSIPSLGSEDSTLHIDSINHFLDFERLMHCSEEVDDLTSKPSLIPLNLDNDDPILPFVTNDFMWCSSSEESTWSSKSSSPTSNCSSSPRLDHNSCLGKLLTANTNGNEGRREYRNNYSRSPHSEIANRSTVRNQSGTFACNNRATSNHRSNTTNNQSERSRRRYSSNASRSSINVKSNNLPLSNVHNNGIQSTKRDGNNQDEDRRKLGNGSVSQAMVAAKRSYSENWNRSSSNKRSKQAKAMVIVSVKGGSGSINKRVQDSTSAMMNAVAASKQTNSVLMNLLVNGCDLNAGYVCVNSTSNSNSVKSRFNSASTTADKYSSVFNSPLICMSSK